jgi:SAM-dependent methyltransferase
MPENKTFTRMIPKPIEQYLVRLGARNAHLDYGRDIILRLVGQYINSTKSKEYRVLDLGAGTGMDLTNIRDKFHGHNVTLYGIENFEPNVELLRGLGVAVNCIDIERESLPFEDSAMDIVIANQVIEHTKDIFFIFSEVSRVLKTGGIAIVGFPNLAAFHNRVLLVFGGQPTCIRMPGPHVRGITKGAFCQFITTDGYFEVEQIIGSNFYPFPPRIAVALATAIPSLAISLYFLCRRTNTNGRFIDVLNTRFYETNYFTGQ